MRSNGDEILIVGAGPVGLYLACNLLRRGIGCRLIDAGDGPTPPEQSRAFGVHARTLEILRELDLSNRLVDLGHRVSAMELRAYDGRLGRIELDFDALQTEFPFVLTLSQGMLERELIQRLDELGGRVEWRHRLERMRPGEDAVGVETFNEDTGSVESTMCDWVIGCDGAHSAVRHQLGLLFEGAAYEEFFLLIDASLDWTLDHDAAQLIAVEDGVLAALPLPQSGRWRLIDATGASAVEDDEAIAARFNELLHKAGCDGVTVRDVTWASRFRIHRRVVNRLRAGRCLLAGDSAHLFSPVGAQGMNTGILDAHNLAWKLAGVVQGAMPGRWLDSYSDERLRIARRVSRITDRATRVVTARHRMARSIRNSLIGAAAKTSFLRQRLALELSGLGHRYRRGLLVAADDDAAVFDSGPRPGARVPDILITTNGGAPTRLQRALSVDRFTLLFTAGDPSDLEAVTRTSANTLPAGVDRRALIPDDPSDRTAPAVDDDREVWRSRPELVRMLAGRRDAAYYLIRPDGHVAARGILESGALAKVATRFSFLDASSV